MIILQHLAFHISIKQTPTAKTNSSECTASFHSMLAISSSNLLKAGGDAVSDLAGFVLDSFEGD